MWFEDKVLDKKHVPREKASCEPFFSNEKPGRRTLCSTSGDFGKFISKSLARAKKKPILTEHDAPYFSCSQCDALD